MIPVLAIVRIRHAKGGFTLWAPVALLWPLLVLTWPILAVGCLVQGRNPFAATARGWGLIFALRGVDVAVDSPASSVRVRVI